MAALAACLLVWAGPAGAVSLGAFSVLAYNVAGLPGGLSSSTPEVNNALISPLLNGFDLVAVQEDFGFHADLTSQLTHPFQSVKDTTDTAILLGLLGSMPAPHLGDGLNRFSRTPFSGFQRVTWDRCFGILNNKSDCLAPKGFSVARHRFSPGAFVDVYNLHADAGGEPPDQDARRAQLRQLADFIGTYSADRAVIVLGDTNSRYTRAGDILPELLAQTGLRDVWVDLARDGLVPDVGPKLDACVEDGLSGGDCERIDKIFYRSGGNVVLEPLGYQVQNVLFIDDADRPLSDHEPVSVHFEIGTVAVPEPAASVLVALGVLGVAANRRRVRRPVGAPTSAGGRA